MENILKKYYAVKAGRTTGILGSWAECEASVKGYAGAVFKSFTTLEEATDYLNQKAEPVNESLPFAYIDGSYSKSKGVYGYGGYISFKGLYYLIQGTGSAEGYLQYRNITGEVRGAIEVIKRAIEIGIPELNLYYDYAGIEQWALGGWRCLDPVAEFYKGYYDRKSQYIKIHFVKVKGHTGNEGNELADLLAKDAVGAKMTKKATARVQEFKSAENIVKGA